MLTTGWRDQASVTVEVTPGTPVAPVAADVLRVIDSPRTFQTPEFLISQERLNATSVDALIKDAYGPGEFTLKTYLKASGTAGTPINAGYRACLTGLYGRETVTGGNNVTYNLLRISQDTRKTYTIFKKFGDGMTLQNAGCLFNIGDIAIRKRGNESLLQASFGGPFFQQRWAGQTLTVAGGTTTIVKVTAGTAKRFSAGAYIKVTGVTPDPVQITSIDYATDFITVPTLSGAPGTGVVVAGHFPTPSDAGSIISGWRGVGTLDATAFPHREVDIHIDNKIGVIDDVRDGSAYPGYFIEGEDKREVTVKVNHYFDSSDVGGMHGWYDADQEITRALVFPVGTVAGRIFTFNFPQSQLASTPEEDTSGRVMLTRLYRAKATTGTGDDEHNLVLT